MRNQLYRPYSSTEAVSFALPDMTGADFNTATALASGDVQISKDGAAFANVTNLPSNSSGQVVWTPAAGELTAKSIRLRVRDQTSPAEFPAMLFVIETYGHASAMHPNLGWLTGDAHARLGAPVGASISADITDARSRLPAALVGGRMDANVGAMANNVLTAAAIADNAITAAKLAADAITAAKIADGAIDAATLAANTITAAKLASDARQAIAQEVLLALVMGRGNKVEIVGSDIVLKDTDGTTVISTQPFTRLPSTANPIATVG